MSKRLINATNKSLSILLVIAIIVVVNFLSYQIFYRLDLTQSKDYSISKVSKDVASELDDVVNVKVYFSENLPNQYINLRQEVGDILDEYANYSKGKVRVEFIDPKDDKDLQRELSAEGIPQLQFNVLEKDKYQVVNGYLGMVVQYGDRKEPIPVIQNSSNLEYDITLAIKKATGQINAIIGFVTSNGTAGTDTEIKTAYKKLQELYTIRDVDLKVEKDALFKLNTLIIDSPKEKFNENELKAIDAFLMRGGSLLFLVDGVKIDKGLVASTNDVGLDKFLENYGLRLNHDIVADVSSGMASFTQGFMTFTTNYPFWPKVTKKYFDKDNASVAKLESLILPWASSIEITEKMDRKNSISYLAKTTERGWRQTENFDLNPQQGFSGDNAGQYDLAISVSGKFLSAYGKESSAPARIGIVGDADFLNDNFLQNNPDNLVFFQNFVDSLSLDEDLINIRSKAISERPLMELSEGAKAAIRYGNIFGVTIVVVTFGLLRYYLRRKSMSSSSKHESNE